jgi:hypothetical protein
MALSPINALAHTIFPNWLRIKGPATAMSALERKDLVYLDSLWQQAYVTHNPQIYTVQRDPYRVAVVSLPAPKDMGDAHMCGIAVKKTEPGTAKYYLLEHDYVLATKQNRTIITQKEGRETIKHGECPAPTGDFAVDAPAFLVRFMNVLETGPTGTLPR